MARNKGHPMFEAGTYKDEEVGGPVGAIAGTVPCAIVGAVTAGLTGNKIGTAIDRKKT